MEAVGDGSVKKYVSLEKCRRSCCGRNTNSKRMWTWTPGKQRGYVRTALQSGCRPVRTLWVFHETQARPVYDVAYSERRHSAARLWTSHRALQDMLARQMKYWEANPHNVAVDLIELVVKTALLSNHEAVGSLSSSSAEEDRIEFVKIQKASISLLRLVSEGQDE